MKMRLRTSIGTDIMATDTRGSTPLHLALSRLRMLSLSTSDEFVVVQRKMEVEKARK